jgi:hypothetical protein
MAFIYDLTDTWNAGGTSFNGIKMNVTDTASAAASRLMTLQVGGAERFGVRKDGQGYFAGNVGIGTSSPIARLDVVGAADTYARINDGTVNLVLQSYTTGSSAIVGTTTNHALTLWANSAERMRIDSSGNMGVGTSSPGKRLEVNAVGSNAAIRLKETAAYGVSWDIDVGSANAMTFNNNAGSALPYVFLNGDVGIGTSSPGSRLTVSGGNATAATIDYNGGISAGTEYSALRFTASALGFVPAEIRAVNTNGGQNLGVMQLFTSGAERARITSGGALLVGTVNTAYFASGRGNITVNGATSALYGLRVADVESGYLFADTDGVEVGAPSAKVIRFNIAGERMRIDSSGNLLVGTTTAGGVLTVAKSGGRAYYDALGSFFTIDLVNSGARRAFFGYGESTGQWQLGNVTAGGVEQAVLLYDRGDASLRLGTNGTERMRITSGGNVGIGTTAPYSNLETAASGGATIGISNTASGGGILYGKLAFYSADAAGGFKEYGGQIRSYSGIGIDYGDLRFYTANGAVTAERARITSVGDLLVGKTAVNATVVGSEIHANGTIVSSRPGSTNATSTMEVYSTGAAAYRFFVDMAGTVSATSATINAISDIRLKENVRDLDAGLDTILALKPRRFDWKEGKGKNVKDDMGFIAQEVEDVLPALVGGWKAGEGEPDDLKSVKAGDLIPVLVKAIQELTARVAQLEGN